MMNGFYHNVEIGFNWWYIVMPCMMFVMFLIGMSRFSMSGRSMVIRKKRNSRLYLGILAGMLDTVLCLLIVFESVVGILQMLINHLEDIGWLPLVAAMALLGMVVLNYYILYGSGRVGMWIAHGYLAELRAVRRAEARKKFRAPNLSEQETSKKWRVPHLSEDDVEVIAPNY